MFKELNPLLHSELRLAVMSLLISVEEADFVYIRQQTKATAGNLSVQIDKLAHHHAQPRLHVPGSSLKADPV